MFSNSSTKAGKVAFYILNSLKYTKRKDLEFKSEDSENIFIELNVTPRKPLECNTQKPYWFNLHAFNQ